MKINELYISNYKMLKNFKIEFKDLKLDREYNGPKLSVIIGENGTGKTTILEFLIKTLSGNINSNNSKIFIDKPYNYKGSNILHDFKENYTSPRNIVISTYTPFDKLNISETEIKNSKVPIKKLNMSTNKFNNLASGIMNNYLTDEVYNIDKILDYLGFRKFILSFELSNYKLESAPERAIRNLLNRDNLNYLEEIINFNYDKEFSPNNIRIKNKIENNMLKFKKFNEKFNNKNYVSESKLDFVQLILSKIIIICEKMKRISSPIYHELKSGKRRIIEIQSIIDKYPKGIRGFKEDLEFMKNYGIENIFSDIWIEQNYSEDMFPLSTLSSGELSLLIRFLDLYESVQDGSLVLIDEPETHLHPKWIRDYVSKIFEIIGDKQCHIIIATHSPLIVSDVPSECIIALKKDYNQVSQVVLQESTLGMSYDTLLKDIFGLSFSKGKMIKDYTKKAEEFIEKEKIDDALEIYKLLGSSVEKFKLYKLIAQAIGDLDV
ncbi:AAA family ATPase [Lysinibacillus sp. OTC-L20]|uniref:AAA family ATPase n=1 Tax=Lysinibacillus sp. OTC-L20 TaxID=3342791 RepID=UPI0035BA8E1A